MYIKISGSLTTFYQQPELWHSDGEMGIWDEFHSRATFHVPESLTLLYLNFDGG